jgi:hypothetical protein
MFGDMYGETYGELTTGGRWFACACIYGLPYPGMDGYPIFKLCTDTIGEAYGADRVGIAPGPYCIFILIAGDATRDGGGSEGSAGTM